jgi:hypothetical protein
MKRLHQAIAGALLASLVSCQSAIEQSVALCHTDTECAELCPEGTRDLPPDHPDYCDGGPQS